MPLLDPFPECKARPDEDGQTYLLKDHLKRVKEFMEQRVGTQDRVLAFLAGLAGICHDAAKAHVDWQRYIDPNHSLKKGPHHSPPGAFLFSYLAYQWLLMNGEWENYQREWLWFIRDIADHHGDLKSLKVEGWILSWEPDKIDLHGMHQFLVEMYPELKEIECNEHCLDRWKDEIWEFFEEALDKIYLGYRSWEPLGLMRALQSWRELTTTLIAGDRFDVKNLETSFLSKEDHQKCDQNIDCYCQQNHEHPLAMVRLKAQQDILQQLADEPNSRFYTVEMPTGYGKTITSLKMASWFGQHKEYNKIIYVAPYLSILEQTSKVIEEAMQVGVLEHHSLAVLEEGDQKGKEDKELRLPFDQLAMQSWANSIVCTSFQQWSRGLFPKKAQDTLRRAFLAKSVVIIDEPQIFSPEGWNVFLCGMEALAEQYDLRIIFLSATMPPFKYGLTTEPVSLRVEGQKEVERYQIVNVERMDECEVADLLLSRKVSTQAAILNTIEDAYKVYQLVEKEAKNPVYLLHGLMIPLHKKIEISKIQHHLKHIKELPPLYVISTQIIEAGVDVSFRHVLRASAILPSIVQAAGRVNRHQEGDIGTLSIVPFYRGGTKDTRRSIYKSEYLRNLTDQLLGFKEVWMESEMLPLIRQYYHDMFRHNTYEAGKQAVRAAYEGNWPELSKFQPFGQDYLRLPIFIPWDPSEEDQKWLPKRFKKLQQKFKAFNSEQVYHLYENRSFLKSLSFEERKQFMILFHFYVLNVPMQVALSIANREEYLHQRIPYLYGNEAYDQVTGLTRHFDEHFDNII